MVDSCKLFASWLSIDSNLARPTKASGTWKVIACTAAVNSQDAKRYMYAGMKQEHIVATGIHYLQTSGAMVGAGPWML